MAEAFLLLWNPARYAWDDYDHDYGRFRRGRRVELDWSTGQRRSIPVGSRVYLLKLGEIYDAMAEAARPSKPSQTRLDPPPADPLVAHPERTRPAWAKQGATS